MNAAHLTYRNSTIHYRYSGEGPRCVICFHGFGTYAATFDWLAGHVPGHRFIAFDLPYHGRTQWNDGDTFTPAQLMDIIDACPHLTDRRFGIMGFSLGGRISLQLAQDFPERIERIVLLAPDGLHMNPMYWFASQTAIGNRMLKRILQKPAALVRMARRAEAMGLANKGIVRFVERYLEDARMRELVYHVWTTFRRFRPNPRKLARLLSDRNIPVTLIYGRHDTIIPLAPGEKFFSELRGRKKMEILDSGHQILDVRNAPYLAEAFNL